MSRETRLLKLRLRTFCFLLVVGGISPARADHVNYAVLFSGGGDPAVNDDRFYDEALRMWNITVNKLGFSAANVFVLFADGTDPAVDRSSGVNSDWSVPVSAGSTVQPATSANLQALFGSLTTVVSGDASLYFWSFDHGGNTSPPTLDGSSITAWGGSITSADFATWVNPIQAESELFAFAQCNSSGMVHFLDPSPGGIRFATWAARWDEASFGSGWADAWANGLEGGLWSTSSLATYAAENDLFAEFGLEHPGFTGSDFDILTGKPVPEPSSIALLVSVLAVLLWRGAPRAPR